MITMIDLGLMLLSALLNAMPVALLLATTAAAVVVLALVLDAASSGIEAVGNDRARENQHDVEGQTRNRPERRRQVPQGQPA